MERIKQQKFTATNLSKQKIYKQFFKAIPVCRQIKLPHTSKTLANNNIDKTEPTHQIANIENFYLCYNSISIIGTAKLLGVQISSIKSTHD